MTKGMAILVIKELDVVRLKDGREATVHDVYNGGEEYLVEVSDEKGRALDMPTVKPDEIAEVIWRA